MSDDKSVLLQCIHNALWMTEHETAMKAVDQHIMVLDPARKARAIEMLREIMEPVQ